jgi:polysaccharide export outer membrane protein
LLRWAAFTITPALLLTLATITISHAPRRGPEDAGLASHRLGAQHRDVRRSSMPTYPEALCWELRTLNDPAGNSQRVQLCQYQERAFCGVDSGECPSTVGESLWMDWRPIPWQTYGQGEYVGPQRSVHLPEYRIRVDDELEFVYLFTHNESGEPYRFGVGDELIIESLTDETLNRGDLTTGRGLEIQPDGTVTLRLLGQFAVAGRTVEEIRKELETRYTKYYQVPAITVTPLKTNTQLEDLKATIDARAGTGGLVRAARVTPEGTVQLPGIGDVPAHGLTTSELEREVEARYVETVGPGIEITPVLVQRAPRFVYVLGEVVTPGRYSLEGPTTVMQAIALAGGWNNGGNLREVVVFRRAEDWRLMATKLDLRGALLGKRPSPCDEIWLRDSDLVVVPKSPILLADEFIELVFTRGIYGVVPFQGVSINISQLSTL